MPPKSKAEKYHDMLRPMMSFIHNGTPFGVARAFTCAELEVVTPEKIMEYLMINIYQDPAANPDIDPPKILSYQQH